MLHFGGAGHESSSMKGIPPRTVEAIFCRTQEKGVTGSSARCKDWLKTTEISRQNSQAQQIACVVVPEAGGQMAPEAWRQILYLASRLSSSVSLRLAELSLISPIGSVSKREIVPFFAVSREAIITDGSGSGQLRKMMRLLGPCGNCMVQYRTCRRALYARGT